MSSQLEELQRLVNDERLPSEQREAAAKHILALQGVSQPEQINDDQVKEFMEAENKERAANRAEFGNFFPPVSFEQAAQTFTRHKRGEQLHKIALDESRPMADRLEAVRQMIAEALCPREMAEGNPNDKPEQFLERMIPHPDRAKLIALHQVIHDSSQLLTDRLEAVKNVRELRAKYPRRYVGCSVSKDIEQAIAYQFSASDPEQGKTRDSYATILRRVGVLQ